MKERKQGLRTKKGTYIMEASLVIPAVFIAMLLLVSVIPIISTAEDALFVMGDELRMASIKSAFSDEPLSTPIMTAMRMSDGTGEAKITDYKQGFSSNGIDDLIAMEITVDFSGRNPLGGISKFGIRQRVMTRSFSGKNRKGESGIADHEESRTVYVFPHYGTKYHNRDCYFLNPASQRVILTNDIKRKFGSCSNCHSSGARLGDIVYCFFNDGKVYHLETCSSVDKFYIEMEQKDAESRGYSPCASCGG